MTGATHRIRRHQWRVKAPSAESAFATRMQLRAEMDSLLSVFEEAFDAVAANDEVVRIPILLLELKLPREASIAESFPPLLLEELGKALRRWKESVPAAPGVRRITRTASRREMLLHYLSHGRMQWHESADKTALVVDLRTEASAFASDIPGFMALLHGSADERVATCFRWLQLLGADERSAAVAAVLERTETRALASSPGLRALVECGDRAEHEALRIQALVLAFASLGAGGRDASARPVLREAFERAGARVILETLAEHAARPDSTSGVVETETRRLQPASETFIEPLRTDEIADGIVAHDAGLVLLHPYLPRLFEAAGIVTGDAREIPEASLARAAALLHYLLRGEEEIHELELVVIKLLLGIVPDRMVLVGAGLLTAQDHEEADALLAAVITHWSALGSTSAAGLRRTFLQRRGALRDLGHAWSVRVEPGAFDVLLASLPWTIGTVKLPWTTKPIFIDWPTR